MPPIFIRCLKWRVSAHVIIASLLTATLVACGQAESGANAPAPANTSVLILDKAALAKLRLSFLELAGSDRVAFTAGSAELTPKAQSQLERQALWLTGHPEVAVRFRSESSSAAGVEDRRLAVRRVEAVQAYLQASGVRSDQFVGVDIEFGPSGTVTTLIDAFHFGEPAARKASIDIGQLEI